VTLIGWADAWADGSWVEASWGESAAQGMNLEGWADDAWEQGSMVSAAWGYTETTPEQRARAAGVRRTYVEIDGRLRRIDSYEEAERLLADLHKEEKLEQKDRKELKVLLKKVEKAPDMGGALLAKVELVERRIEARQERIEELTMLIQLGLEALEDEEEELLLLM
jgi:hypothetical protein